MNSAFVVNLMVIVIFCGYLSAKPYHTSDGEVDVLYTQNETGNYEFHIFDKDSKKEEKGKIEKTKEGTYVPQIKGYYYYEEEMGDKDVVVSVNYTADENGYRATVKINSYSDSDDDRIGKDCLTTLCGGGVG